MQASSRSELDLALIYRDIAHYDVEYKGSRFASVVNTVVTSSAHIDTVSPNDFFSDGSSLFPRSATSLHGMQH